MQVLEDLATDLENTFDTKKLQFAVAVAEDRRLGPQWITPWPVEHEKRK